MDSTCFVRHGLARFCRSLRRGTHLQGQLLERRGIFVGRLVAGAHLWRLQRGGVCGGRLAGQARIFVVLSPSVATVRTTGKEEGRMSADPTRNPSQSGRVASPDRLVEPASATQLNQYRDWLRLLARLQIDTRFQ